MKDFHELKIWQRSHRLTLDVYKATASFPKAEMYGLTSQIRRCSASIPANIAEGCGRNGDMELARFFQIALGSAGVPETFIVDGAGIIRGQHIGPITAADLPAVKRAVEKAR